MIFVTICYLFTRFSGVTPLLASTELARSHASLMKCTTFPHFRDQAKVFDVHSSMDDVVSADENALVSL